MILELFKLGAGCTANVFPPNWYDNLPCTTDPGTGATSIGLNSAQDLFHVIANATRIVIALSGALAVIMIVLGGIYYIISQGDPGKIKQAKEVITQAVTGLIVVMLSYAIVTFINGRF